MFKLIIWYIFKKKDCIGKLSNIKGPGRPQRATKGDEFFPLQTSSFTLEEIGINVQSKDTFVNVNTEGLPPLVTLKDRTSYVKFGGGSVMAWDSMAASRSGVY